MSVTESSRHELHTWFEEAMGPERAATLMSLLPPVGWADVATKHDLLELERRLDLRIDALDLQIDALDERLTGRIDALDERFTGRIDALDLRIDALDERLCGKADALDERLCGKVGALDERLCGKVGALDERMEGAIARSAQAQTRTFVTWMLGLHGVLLGAVATATGLVIAFA